MSGKLKCDTELNQVTHSSSMFTKWILPNSLTCWISTHCLDIEVVDEYLMRDHKMFIILLKLIDKLGMQKFNVSGVEARDMLA